MSETNQPPVDAQPPKEEAKATQPPADGANPKPKRERKPKVKKDAENKDGEQAKASGDKAPQYRVKGAADKKEDAGEAKQRPQTAAADGTTEGKPKRKRAPKKKDGEGAEEGKDGNDEEKKTDKPRAKTARDKNRKKADAAGEDGATPGEGEETKGGEEAKEAKERPKNTVYQNPMEYVEKRKFKDKWEEYRLGAWRRTGKTYVTMETVIPEMPAKHQILTAPDEKKFITNRDEIEKKIKDISATLEEKKTQFEDTLAAKKASLASGNGDSAPVPSKGLTEKFKEMKTLKAQRQVIYDAVDKATQGQADLLSQREILMKKIDRQFNTTELVPKGIKEQEKKLATSSGGKNVEALAIKRIEFLKQSLGPIAQKEKLDATISAQNAAKKEASVGLNPIKNKMKDLQKQIDEVKAEQSAKTESKENYDKQLDEINDKRKALREKRDKLYKEKEAARDEYYGSLIQFQKQSQLIRDIEWMTTMQNQIKSREAERESRQKAAIERKEKIAKEREEKKQRELERKQRIEEKKARDEENKRIAEQNARQDQIDNLSKIEKDIQSNNVRTNPMYDQIQQCDELLKFCKKSIQGDTKEETKEENGPADIKKVLAKGIEDGIKKGSLQKAMTKAEKEKEAQVQLGNQKKNKGRKQTAGQGVQDKQIDLKLIRQFNNLKISAPLHEEDYPKTETDLKELREALIYWGKIIQRQNKIKFIKMAKKICNEEQFINQAVEEEKFIENEKLKFEGDDVSEKTHLKLDKLKIAQVIDREQKNKTNWNDADEDSDMSDEEGVFRADDVVENEDGEMVVQNERGQKRGRGGRGGAGVAGEEGDRPKRSGPKKASRGAQKFSEIMKNQEAFPTLDREDDDEEEDEEVTTPGGEVAN